MGFFRPSKNYYHILGVSPTATLVQIKTAWKLKVKEWHPDLVRSNSEKIACTRKLQELNEAREILEDIGKRREYDNWFQSHLKHQPIYSSKEEEGREKSSKATWPIIWPRLLGIFLLSLWIFGTLYGFFEMGGFTVQSANPAFGVLKVFGRFLGSAIISFFLMMGLVIPFGGVVWLLGSLAWDEAKVKPTKEIIRSLIDSPKVIGILLLIGGLGFFLMHLAAMINAPDLLKAVIILIGSLLAMGLLAIPVALVQIIAVVIYLVWARKILQKTEALMRLPN